MFAYKFDFFKFLKLHIGELFFSIIFGLTLSLASHLIKNDTFALSIGQIAIAFLLCFVFLCLVEIIIDKVTVEDQSYSDKYNLKIWAIIWIVGMIVDFMCLLTYFPGVGMNDGLNILYFGMSASNQFPVFYCAFITLLSRIGSYFGNLQISIVLYSIIQIIVMSAACAFIATWFYRKCAPKWMKYLIMIYLIGEPLLTMYSISMLKDSLFSVLLIVFTLFVYDFLIEKKEVVLKWEWGIIAISILGILWLRNNGIYIIFPMIIILLIVCSSFRKEMVNLLLMSIIAVLFSNIAMSYYNQTQMFQELVGVPIQQMAAVIANDGNMTEDQRDFINQIMPLDEIKENYNPNTVDPIKWDLEEFNDTFLESHKKEFLLTWAQMLPSNLMIYIKAYLQQTFWFWAPYQQGTVQGYYTIESVSTSSWLTDFMEENGIHDQPLLPAGINRLLRDWFSLANKFLREGVCFWIVLATLLLQLVKRKKCAYIGVYAPVLLLWLTIMISTPVASSMRYVLAFVYGLPVFIGLLFVNSPVEETNHSSMERQVNENE